MESLGFYSERVLKLLEKCGVEAFTRVRLVLNDGTVFEGIVLPRPEYGDPDVLIVKLPNGYNIGIHVSRIAEIKPLGKAERKRVSPPEKPAVKGLPKVALLGTGGTILSKVDYVSGAVYPSYSVEELYAMVPDIAKYADIDIEVVMSIFSEDMSPRRWSEIAAAAERKFRSGAEAVIIFHGTDTMAYSAAALAFAMREAPGPIVFVGAQRSSDRPSSDAFLNILAAVITAVKAPFAESVICMHAESSDTKAAVHRGVRARKMHTSRRDAFRSINAEPIAYVDMERRTFEMNTREYIRRGKDVKFQKEFDEKVALIKFYPGMDPEILHFLIDKGYHGIVIEGTGLGHVGEQLLDPIKRAIDAGIPIVITSQCLYGRVNLNVYRRGVQLLKLGVIPAEDMIPETAYVKLSWVLARERDLDKVRELMLTNIAHELSYHSNFRTYLA